jgi:hypothetical protein
MAPISITDVFFAASDQKSIIIPLFPVAATLCSWLLLSACDVGSSGGAWGWDCVQYFFVQVERVIVYWLSFVAHFGCVQSF